MKSILFIIFMILAGCDPGYNCYIENSSGADVFLRTSPSIESLYDQRSTYLETISHYRVGEVGGLFVYRVQAGSQFKLYGHIGLKPNLKEIPFERVDIIHDGDTVILDSKEKILARLSQIKRSTAYILKF